MTIMTIRDQLLQAVARYDLLDPHDRVLVAVSGGQDSLALLMLLHDLVSELQLELVVGHLHHGLRGEVADADQQHVGELAAQLGLPYATDRTDVAALAKAEGVGVEAAGRRARYAFFDRAADAHGCNKIALAHTATDRAETLLMNLFRGAGLPGLRSIPPRRGRIIRPLILVSRQETGEYCRITNMKVRLDSTNLDPTPLRNRVRANLLPQLEQEYGPGIEAALCRAAEHVLAEIEWTEPFVAQALEAARQDEGLAVAPLQEMPRGLRQRVLRRFLAEAGHPLTDLSQERWEALEALVESGGTGRRLELSAGPGVELIYGVLQTVGPEDDADHCEAVFRLPVPGRVDLPDGSGLTATLGEPGADDFPPASADEAVLDADRAGDVLLVRQPRPGDRFVPLGMSGQKKLQDFFVDEKVPPRQRRPWLVTDEAGDILWVVGHRVAEAARVHDPTARRVMLRLSRPAGGC